MNNDDTQNPTPIFCGAVQRASYSEQLVGRYKGNPAIESLPQILSAENAVKLLAHYPERDPQEAAQPGRKRPALSRTAN